MTSALWFVGGVFFDFIGVGGVLGLSLMCCVGVGDFGVVMVVICVMSECGFSLLVSIGRFWN